MTQAETTAILRQFNEWRRGDEDIPHVDPRKLGEAIDAAVEMIDRLEAAEKERDAAELMSLALRAKVAEMERQEPVAVVEDDHNADGLSARISEYLPAGMMLYGLPGARPAPSVPDDWMQHAARMAALARKLREPDWHFESIREMQRELCALEEAALAAAPEAKP